MTAAEGAKAFAGHHEAFEGIATTREVWLPGVDTLSLAADGSVRAYLTWTATSNANGHVANLRAYHYWNFDEAGKINQEGGFHHAERMGSRVHAGCAPAAEDAEVAE